MTGTGIATIGSLTRLVDHAAAILIDAHDAAEIIEAFDLAKETYAQARRFKAMIKAKKANDELLDAVHRVEADALIIKSKAQARLADEYDAAQERGEVANGRGQGPGFSISDENTKATVADLGLTSAAIFRAREIRDGERADPGVVERTVNEAVEQGREPSSANVRAAAREATGLVNGARVKSEGARQLTELKMIGEINDLKKYWSLASIPARRAFLRDLGITDTPGMEEIVRFKFSVRSHHRHEKTTKLKLPRLSTLPVLK